MGISTKGRRKIICDNQTYVWSVGSDDDSPCHILQIHSEDKQFAISCPLQTETPYVISKGSIFQGIKKLGRVTHTRYLLPFAVPDPITPKFVAALIRWATTEGGEARRIEWNGTKIPI